MTPSRTDLRDGAACGIDAVQRGLTPLLSGREQGPAVRRPGELVEDRRRAPERLRALGPTSGPSA